MDRAGLFVDAGYLLSAGGQLTLSTSRRSDFDVKVAGLAEALRELVEKDSGLPLLRTYWYDAVRNAQLTLEHRRLRDCPLVKLRLGKVTISGQKGVDSLIFRDITNLARERAICTAYLVAGDEDLREAVSIAQEVGVQVILISVIPTDSPNTSEDLVTEADRILDLESAWLRPFFESRAD